MPKRRTKASARKKSPTTSLDAGTRRIIGGIVQLAIAALFFLSLFDAAGPVGISIKTALQFVFGAWGIIFAIGLLVSGVFHAAGETFLDAKRSVGLTLCLLSFLGLVHLGADLRDMGPRSFELGGAIGFMVSLPFKLYMSDLAGYILLPALLLIGVFLVFEPDFGSIVALLSSKKPAYVQPP